jgi:hypothetical protein
MSDLGFYHPEKGYWQATGGDAEALLETYPQGTIQVALKPSGDHVWQDGKWVYVDPPVVIPSEVSPAQAEIALYRFTAGGALPEGAFLGQVNALINTYPYEPVRIWWRKATYISRSHPYLAALALELELSDETVDALFVAAAAI